MHHNCVLQLHNMCRLLPAQQFAWRRNPRGPPRRSASEQTCWRETVHMTARPHLLRSCRASKGASGRAGWTPERYGCRTGRESRTAGWDRTWVEAGIRWGAARNLLSRFVWSRLREAKGLKKNAPSRQWLDLKLNKQSLPKKQYIIKCNSLV